MHKYQNKHFHIFLSSWIILRLSSHSHHHVPYSGSGHARIYNINFQYFSSLN